MAYTSPPPHASTSAPTTFQTSPAESNYPLSPSPSPSSNRRTSANGNSGSNSSKSVLTIALQRAQSAVLLDSANNVVGAVAAYSQAVKLLEQVMIRVEETTKKDRSSRVVEVGAVGDSEVEIKERLRRLAKLERKDRAKEEEARRLKVIVSFLEVRRW